MRGRRLGRMVAVAMVLAALVALSGGCGRDGASGDDDTVRVVAAFYPLFEAAGRVGDDRIDLVNLTPAGAEPHDLELGTDAVDRIEDADLVIYLGGGFQPAIEEVVERIDGVALDVLPADSDDPHVWLDPNQLASIVGRIRDALVEVDAGAGAAASYRSNADAYVAELNALDDAMAAGLESCERRAIFTAHQAFGHLADRYDLEERAVAGLSPEAEPDPATMAELADDIAAQGATTVFTEALVAPDVAETLAREAGVRTAVLDPLEGLSRKRSADGATYVTVMRENLAALVAALGCR